VTRESLKVEKARQEMLLGFIYWRKGFLGTDHKLSQFFEQKEARAKVSANKLVEQGILPPEKTELGIRVLMDLVPNCIT